MPIHFPSVSPFITPHLRKNAFPSLITQQKKLCTILLFAMSCIAACFMMMRYYRLTVRFSIPSSNTSEKVNTTYNKVKREVKTPLSDPANHIHNQKAEETQDKVKEEETFKESLPPQERQPSDQDDMQALTSLVPSPLPQATISTPPKTKLTHYDLYEKQSTENIKKYWKENKDNFEELKELFYFTIYLNDQIYMQNLEDLLYSLTESDIQNLVSQKIDVFRLNETYNEKGVQFLFKTLSILQIKALFKGLFSQNELPNSWVLIHCIQGINRCLKADEKNQLFTHLIATLYSSHYKNYDKLKKYLEISDYRDGDINSPRTKAMIAFIENYIVIALETEAHTKNLLNLLEDSEPLLMTYCLKQDFLDTLTLDQQTKLKKWAKENSKVLHILLEQRKMTS